MSNIIAEFDYIDRTHDLRIGEEEPQETRFETAGELYRFCLHEYGRCVSSSYIDLPNGKAQRIGWVFQKNVKYTDCEEYYLQETWVTIHEAMPERKITYHYAELAAR